MVGLTLLRGLWEATALHFLTILSSTMRPQGFPVIIQVILEPFLAMLAHLVVFFLFCSMSVCPCHWAHRHPLEAVLKEITTRPSPSRSTSPSTSLHSWRALWMLSTNSSSIPNTQTRSRSKGEAFLFFQPRVIYTALVLAVKVQDIRAKKSFALFPSKRSFFWCWRPRRKEEVSKANFGKEEEEEEQKRKE